MSVTNLKPFLDVNDIVIWHGKLDGKMLIAITNYLSEVCLVYIENKSPMQLSFEDWDNFNGSIEQYIYPLFPDPEDSIDYDEN